MNVVEELKHRLVEHLQFIYPDADHDNLSDQLIATMDLSACEQSPSRHQNHWDEKDVLLITYGDSIVAEDEKPLHTLKTFLDERLNDTVNAVHILPFFPYSSDDGFAVIDYLVVNPSLGEWEDISAIAADYRLMADLVVNHTSSRSRWFENFKKRVDPGKDYFMLAEPDDPLDDVVRPRNSPLLTQYETLDGPKHVWCTFSADQVDFDFRNPQVLIEFANIIKHYLDRGVSIFRMDAVAFLWKEIGTSCIHLQQTHEIIKLFRTLIEHHTPDAIIITETNVPNRENLTYFGNANEAHVIYNFSLPPLLVYTLVSGDCRHLKTWMMSMPPAQAGTAYLNFIASHDGIGLRPLDGLVEDEEREHMVALMLGFGGKVTYRKAPGGDKAYEINISLYDALKGTMASGPDNWQTQRFICAYAIMFAIEGIPAVYIHSFLATENDYHRLEHTGRARSINRHIWERHSLDAVLADETSHHRIVFDEMKRLLSIRNKQPAFHPNATQFTLQLGINVFAFWRQSLRRDQSIFCIYNISDEVQIINLSDINLIDTDDWVNLISGKRYEDLRSQMKLQPYEIVWLSNLVVP